ncbi:hypothetical protein [Thermoactinospora rubra]|uniref:hypothetical protein n=1 Tax=Thermoactinospora rubra TaxID=1088767 RepID=UPI000A11A543|nr:hypothetical protein [Thermoactinospora rubra]
MPELIAPTARLRESFLSAIAEFHADRDHPVPWFVTDVDPEAPADPSAFDAYCWNATRRRRPAGRASCR